MPIYHNETYNKNGELLFEEIVNIQYPCLSGLNLAATLNAVKGVWTLQEAVDITRLPEEHLIAEAQAWAVAMEVNNDSN